MASDEGTNVEKGNNKLAVIIIVLLTILIVAICAFAVVFLLNGNEKEKPIINKGSSTEDVNKINTPKYSYEIEETTLNLADENQKRYIKITLYLGYDNKKLESELEKKDHIIKDTINSIIRTKSADDFTEKGVENFKKEATKRINSILTTGQIDDIYIYDILVQ